MSHLNFLRKNRQNRTSRFKNADFEPKKSDKFLQFYSFCTFPIQTYALKLANIPKFKDASLGRPSASFAPL